FCEHTFSTATLAVRSMDTSRFVELADTHDSRFDSGDYSKRAIRRANLVADELWHMMQSAFATPQETEILFSLIDHPSAGPWIAFGALEHLDLAEPRKTRCLGIIRALAQGRSLNGAGADLWLSHHGYGA
ncbi:MAG: hypothetical protein ABI197_10990, partial [Granulicella sp.]